MSLPFQTTQGESVPNYREHPHSSTMHSMNDGGEAGFRECYRSLGVEIVRYRAAHGVVSWLIGSRTPTYTSTPEMMRPTIQMTAICPLLICFRFLAGPGGTGLAMRQARVARPRCVEFAYSIPQRRFFRIGSPEPSDRPTPTPPGLCGGACSIFQRLRALRFSPWIPPLDSRSGSGA